jgi:hypothetical protein
MVQLAQNDVEIRVFGGARHSIYNEINRDEVFGVLRRFVERAVALWDGPHVESTRGDSAE